MGRRARLAQSVTRLTINPGVVGLIPSSATLSVVIDHEIFSTVIRPRPLHVGSSVTPILQQKLLLKNCGHPVFCDMVRLKTMNTQDVCTYMYIT